MTTNSKLAAGFTSLLLGSAMFLTGCGEGDTAEKTGAKIDAAVGDMKEKGKEVIKEAKEEVKSGMDKVDKAVEPAPK